MSQTVVVPTPAIVAKFDQLEAAMKTKLYERTWEIRTAIIALIARCHHAQIGARGVGKTYLVDCLVAHIDGLEAHKNYYRTLMTKFTTPPMVCGAVSMKGMKEEDVYRHNTAGMLPEADVAFLDELFEMGEAMSNTLLTMFNEGLFTNGPDIMEIPLATVFAGSNTLPTGSGTAAFVDRIHFKHEVEGIKETGNFIAMLRDTAVPKRLRLARIDPVITWDDILTAQVEADEIEVSELVLEKLAELKSALKKGVMMDGKKVGGGIEPSDRHWNSCIPIVKASAYRAGRTIADLDDMRVLRFVLWVDLKDQAIVKRLILDICNPQDKEASELLDLIEDYALEAAQIRATSATEAAAQTMAIELKGKMERVETRLDELVEEAKKSPTRTEVIEDAKARVTEVMDALLWDMFKL